MEEPTEQKIEIPASTTEIGSDNTWKSCCGLELDQHAVVYFTTVGIISGIMIFAIYKLTTNESCEVQTVYMSLLTMLIGILAPNPQFKKK